LFLFTLIACADGGSGNGDDGNNGALLTSEAGDNWAVRNSSTNNSLKSIASGNNTVFAVGINGLSLQSDPLDPDNGSHQSDSASGGGGGGCFISSMQA
jgi:hypothetical protein